MATLFDPEDILDSLTDSLEMAGINVTQNALGELVVPCVQIRPPALRTEDVESGFVVPESRWTLLAWYVGASGELDTVGEVKFALSILAVLQNPSTLPSSPHFVSWIAGESQEPILQQVGQEDTNQRHLFRREIPLFVNHS